MVGDHNLYILLLVTHLVVTVTMMNGKRHFLKDIHLYISTSSDKDSKGRKQFTVYDAHFESVIKRHGFSRIQLLQKVLYHAIYYNKS